MYTQYNNYAYFIIVRKLSFSICQVLLVTIYRSSISILPSVRMLQRKETEFLLWDILVWYKSCLYILIETSMEAVVSLKC